MEPAVWTLIQHDSSGLPAGSPKDMSMSQPPNLVILIILGKDLCRCNSVKNLGMRASWIIQVCPKSMTSVLIRAVEENSQIQRRPCEDRGRDGSYAVKNPTKPGATGS